MSFKRDGNDFSLLLNLQKRRVSDLLVSHIPEDEAFLMRNGKYSCTVCSHRPVFDTLDMLAVHRKGKKHMYSLTQFLAQKKKDQEHFAAKNPGQPIPKVLGKKPKILGNHHGLLKAKPYSSCTKRKPAINITTVSKNDLAQSSCRQKDETVSTSSQEASVLATYLKSLQTKRNFADVVEETRHTIHQKLSSSPVEKTTTTNPEPVVDYKKPEYSLEEIVKKKECLKLLESGWKKDWKTGKWFKDESVEFDSDEEPPDNPEAS